MQTKSDGFYHAVSVAVVALALTVWGVLSAAGLLESNTFPPVQAIWEALSELLSRGYSGSPFYVQILASMGRALAGFSLAVLLGVPLGIWLGSRAGPRTAWWSRAPACSIPHPGRSPLA